MIDAVSSEGIILRIPVHTVHFYVIRNVKRRNVLKHRTTIHCSCVQSTSSSCTVNNGNSYNWEIHRGGNIIISSLRKLQQSI